MIYPPTEDECSRCPFEYTTQADLISHQTAHRSGRWPPDRRLLDEAWLNEQYHEKGKSASEIAEKINSEHEAESKHLPITNWDVTQFVCLLLGAHVGGGERLDYGPNWEASREAALNRDGGKCQGCGCPESDVNGSLNVHHIRPLRRFDEVEEANRLENLVTLCPSCHRKWEGVPVQPVLDSTGRV